MQKFKEPDYVFSKACEYGVKATVFIGLQTQQGNRASLKAIAREIDSPEAFTAKILQLLVKHQVIVSSKGAAGGFHISPDALPKLKLSQVVAAIDGDRIFKGCGLGLKVCSELQPCPVHHKFKKIRDDLRQMLESTAILELVQELKSGDSVLKFSFPVAGPQLTAPANCPNAEVEN